MLEGSFDVVTAIRDLAVELDVLRRRVRLLEDAVAALQTVAPEPTSASSVVPPAEVPVESAGRKSSKRERVVTDGAADAG